MRKNFYSMKEYKVKIGGNMRKWRNIKGIKQKNLAVALDLSESAISNIENDITDVTLSQLEDISVALDITVEQLFSDPQESFFMQEPCEAYNSPSRQIIEKDALLNAVISSMQKKDEQLQAIMQNVLHTMTSLMQNEKFV